MDSRGRQWILKVSVGYLLLCSGVSEELRTRAKVILIIKEAMAPCSGLRNPEIVTSGPLAKMACLCCRPRRAWKSRSAW